MRSAAALAVLGCVAAAHARAPAAEPVLIAQLRSGQEIEGVILEVGFDPAVHVLFVATQMGTWRLPVGSAKTPLKAPQPHRLTPETWHIAPGASVLIQRSHAPGAKPLDFPPAPTGEATKDAPTVLTRNRNVSAYFGLSKRRILLSKPTGPPDLVDLPRAWSLWDDRAKQLKDLGTFPAASEIVPSASGDAVALISKDAVRFLSSDGTWARPAIQGRFVRCAISNGASRVLLRPADRPTVVSLFTSPDATVPREVDVGFATRGIAIAPNGRAAVAWSGEGKVRRINATDGSIAPPFGLAPGLVAEVSRAAVDNKGRVTAGLSVSEPAGTWSARVVRARADGIVWSVELPLRERAGGLPGLLVPDDRLIVVWTFDEVQVLRAPPVEP